MVDYIFGKRAAAPYTPPEEDERGLGNDLAVGLAKGVAQLPSAVVGMGDVVAGGLGFNRPFDKATDTIGNATGFKPKQWAKDLDSSYSTETQNQAANVNTAWDDKNTSGLDVAKAYLANPRAIGKTIVESSPSMIAGGVLGKAVGAAGLATDGAALAGAGEGSLMAGQAMENIDKNVDARKAALAAATTGVLGGAIGAGSSKIANKLGIGNIETQIATNGREGVGSASNSLAKRMIGGAIQEGPIEEGLQSAVETGAQNMAEDKPFAQGMGRNIVEGSLAGIPMGAAGGIRANPANVPTATSANIPTAEPANVPTAEPANVPTAEPANVPTAEPAKPVLVSPITGTPVPELKQDSGVMVRAANISAEVAPVDIKAEKQKYIAATKADGDIADYLNSPDTSMSTGTDNVPYRKGASVMSFINSGMTFDDALAKIRGHDANSSPTGQLVNVPTAEPANVPTVELTEPANVAPVEPTEPTNDHVKLRDYSHIVSQADVDSDRNLISRYDDQGNKIDGGNLLEDQEAPAPALKDLDIIGTQTGDGYVLQKNQPTNAEIDAGAHQAATSPLNNIPEPTHEEAAVGDYQKGHVELHGMDIAVENPAGSTRSGTDVEGKPWSNEMSHHYGEIEGSKGADGDPVDVFIGNNPQSDKAFVVNQIDPTTGEFDEHKVILAADSKEQADEIYHANHSADWKGAESIVEMPVSELKDKLANDEFEDPAPIQPTPTHEDLTKIFEKLDSKDWKDINLEGHPLAKEIQEVHDKGFDRAVEDGHQITDKDSAAYIRSLVERGITCYKC